MLFPTASLNLGKLLQTTCPFVSFSHFGSSKDSTDRWYEWSFISILLIATDFWKGEKEGKKKESDKENMEVLHPPLLTGDRLSLIGCPNLFPPQKLPCRCCCRMLTTKKEPLWEEHLFWALVFPSCGALQVKHRLNLCADENSVLFPAHDIFRLKPSSNE